MKKKKEYTHIVSDSRNSTEAEEKETLLYTLVLHQSRKKLGISTLEYCVADSIYHLSNNPASQITGWCWASKEIIANALGITPRGVWKIINRLIDLKLVERNKNDRRYLRTTIQWYNNVVLLKLQIRKQGVENVSSHNRNNVPINRNNVPIQQEQRSYNNNININIKKKTSSSKKRKKRPFYQSLEMRKDARGKWWVLPKDGSDWLEFNNKESAIEWK